MTEIFNDEWFIDRVNAHKLILHRTEEQVASIKTNFQKVKILDTYHLGRILVLDNKIQSAKSDEQIYHESLVHPAMLLSGKPEKVLLLGGGEGATLREVLRYKTVKQVTLVDIDEALIRLCEQYLQKFHSNSFEDKRVKLVFEDAVNFIQRTHEKYDVVIMDINDPVAGGPAVMLYTKEFFESLHHVLFKGGIFVTQAIEMDYDNLNRHSVLYHTLASVFDTVESYCEYIPSFSSMWGFIICSNHRKASEMGCNAIDEKLNQLLSSELVFYDGMTHQRLFSLPKIMRNIIKKETKISTKKYPLNVYGG